MWFVLLHTKGGREYARKIGKSLKTLDHHYYLSSVVNPEYVYRHKELTPDNTIIHSRVANPTNTNWMKVLESKEREGFTVINSIETLKLTSNKLQCSTLFNELGLPHPYTIEGNKRTTNWFAPLKLNKEYIMKPYISQGQGVYVKKFKGVPGDDIIQSMPTNTFVVQELIDVAEIYRVICLDGVPMNFTFIDKVKPDEWKVSVCLNKTSMECVYNSDRELLDLAVAAQRAVGGVINFIDIFKTKTGEYSISEINTACNLSIHEKLSGVNISLLIAHTLHRLAVQKERHQ